MVNWIIRRGLWPQSVQKEFESRTKQAQIPLPYPSPLPWLASLQLHGNYPPGLTLCYAMLCYALTLCYVMLCVVRSVNFHVFWQFLLFSLFSNHFLAILGHFWVPWASFFDVFLNTDFAMFFLDHFCTNFKKGENMKSAQNTAPVHRFKGSPV